MTDEKVKRINELYHLQKTVGLTKKEVKEQAKLRKEYIASVKADLLGTLNNASVVEKDGSITPLKRTTKDEE